MNKHNSVIALAGLVFALAFLFIDSAKRVSLVRAVSAPAAVRSIPPVSTAADRVTTHSMILPSGGADGYHWLLQTEAMLSGDGVRIRHVEYDNAPSGREVHWSGSVRWWLAGVAWAYQLVRPEHDMPAAVTIVAAWLIPLALALLLSALVLLLARRLGGVAAALCAVGFVLVQPVYQYWVAGFLDHHAFAAMSCFATIIFIVAGGAGWVHEEGGAPASARMLTERQARRWFIASGVSGGIGLWVSAATIVPALLCAGIAAFAALILTGMDRRAAAARVAPVLWRVWGIAGCVTSLMLYLIEYFPSHLGMRLEVNHPLYAVAWLGAGDFLCRAVRWYVQRTRLPAHDGHRRAPASTTSAPLPWRWLTLDAAAVLLLPVIVLLAGDHTFKVSDAFLWALHADYIVEFENLGRQFAMLRPLHMLQLVLPVILLPVAGLLWRTSLSGNARRAWRVLPLIILGIGVAYVHGILFYALQPPLRSLGVLGGSQPAIVVTGATIVCDALVLFALFVLPARAGEALAGHAQTALVVAVIPMAGMLLLAFQQVRWLGMACTLGLAVIMTVAAAATTPDSGFVWSRARRAVAGVLLLLILVPMPLEAISGAWRYGYPERIAAHQLVVRDVAHTLRGRLGSNPGVVLSSPTITSWLIYFGGVRGIGTLYWENTDGLKTAAAIYGAPSADSARALIDRHGITHIVIDFGEPFVRQYARLARGQRLDKADPLGGPRDAFVLQMLERNSFPTWLRAVPYTPPAITGVQTQPVLILEVVR